MKTKRTFIIASIVYAFFIVNCFSQSVGIGTASFTPDASAILDVNSENKGMLIPRMTIAQRNLINLPTEGLQIYNLDCHCFEYYDGISWISLYSRNNLLSAPASIVGVNAVCSGQTGITYSVSLIPGATSYNWTVPSGSSVTSGQTTNSITVTYGSMSGNICVTGNSTCGTSSPSCLSINVGSPAVATPVFTLGSSSSRCRAAGTVSYEATASNSSGITYTLDATSIAGGNSIAASTGLVTYAAGWTGTSVITASAAGCNGPLTATHTVTVNAIPTASISGVDIICSGVSTTLTASGGNSYLWSNAASSAAITVSPTITTTYTVSATTAGCTGTASATVTVNPSLVNGAHTECQCTTAGGTIVSNGSGSNMCRFNAATCTGGWTQYLNWSTTSAGSCTNQEGLSHGSGSHSWANTAVESVYSCTSGGAYCCTANASATQRGCY